MVYSDKAVNMSVLTSRSSVSVGYWTFTVQKHDRLNNWSPYSKWIMIAVYFGMLDM
jgi:hypothetical protein